MAPTTDAPKKYKKLADRGNPLAWGVVEFDLEPYKFSGFRPKKNVSLSCQISRDSGTSVQMLALWNFRLGTTTIEGLCAKAPHKSGNMRFGRCNIPFKNRKIDTRDEMYVVIDLSMKGNQPVRSRVRHVPTFRDVVPLGRNELPEFNIMYQGHEEALRAVLGDKLKVAGRGTGINGDQTLMLPIETCPDTGLKLDAETGMPFDPESQMLVDVRTGDLLTHEQVCARQKALENADKRPNWKQRRKQRTEKTPVIPQKQEVSSSDETDGDAPGSYSYGKMFDKDRAELAEEPTTVVQPTDEAQTPTEPTEQPLPETPDEPEATTLTAEEPSTPSEPTEPETETVESDTPAA